MKEVDLLQYSKASLKLATNKQHERVNLTSIEVALKRHLLLQYLINSNELTCIWKIFLVKLFHDRITIMSLLVIKEILYIFRLVLV